jgi:hypothetical protein
MDICVWADKKVVVNSPARTKMDLNIGFDILMEL